MARKRRKIAKRREDSSAVAAQQPAWIPSLPWLGGLALIFSWLAALGGAADGSIDWRNLFDHDTVRPYAVFRDLFGGEGYPALGWWQHNAVYYFPDWAFQWALLALGLDMTAAAYIFPLMQVGFAAAGWILVCDFLFGKSPVRRAAVLLLHAASLLLIAWNQSQVFIPFMMGAWHYGAWACVPWLLWLSLRMLNADRPPTAIIAALILAMTTAAASDMLTVLWFALPAAIAVLPSAKPKKSAVFIAVLAVGIALGVGIDRAIPWEGRPGLDHNVQVARASYIDRLNVVLVLRHYLKEFAAKDTPEFAAMLAFAALLCARLAGQLNKRLRAKKNGRAAFHPRLFVLLLIAASVAGSVAALINHGHIWMGYHGHSITAMRYIIPLFFFPLFAGWALFEWSAPRWKVRAPTLAAAACAATVALSAPKMARIDFAAMDPFATPFQTCFAENARRLGWTSGIAPAHFSLLTHLNPGAEVENYITVFVTRRDAGRSSLDVVSSNSNSNRRGKEVQFVVVNARDGRVFVRPPRTGDEGCPLDDYGSCVGWEGSAAFITHAAVAGAFREPSEIAECAGIGLYHYDPPLRFDFGETQAREAIGNKF